MTTIPYAADSMGYGVLLDRDLLPLPCQARVWIRDPALLADGIHPFGHVWWRAGAPSAVVLNRDYGSTVVPVRDGVCTTISRVGGELYGNDVAGAVTDTIDPRRGFAGGPTDTASAREWEQIVEREHTRGGPRR